MVTKPLYSKWMAITVSVFLGSIFPICLRLHYDSFWGVFCACAAIANIVIWRVMKRQGGLGPRGSDTVSCR